MIYYCCNITTKVEEKKPLSERISELQFSDRDKGPEKKDIHSH